MEGIYISLRESQTNSCNRANCEEKGGPSHMELGTRGGHRKESRVTYFQIAGNDDSGTDPNVHMTPTQVENDVTSESDTDENLVNCVDISDGHVPGMGNDISHKTSINRGNTNASGDMNDSTAVQIGDSESTKHVIETEEVAIEMGEDAKLTIVEECRRKVIVHVTYLKFGEINTMKEHFEADVLVKSKWREPLLDQVVHSEIPSIEWSEYWSPHIIIDNCRGDMKETWSRTLIQEEDGAHVLERRRFRGMFFEQLELWDFPFDVQDLTVVVMSDLPATDVELVEDPNEIHRIYRQSFVDEQEWYLYKYIGTIKREVAKDRAEPSVKRSTLFVRACVARRPAYFVYNLFVVTFILSCLAFVTFAVSPTLVHSRLQLSFTLVLTAVAFKVVATQSLPRLSYLTYLDCHVLATMAVVSMITFWHGVQSKLMKRQEGETPVEDHIALATLAGIYFIYNIAFCLRLWCKPYKRRREMKAKEALYFGRLRMKSTLKSAFYESYGTEESEYTEEVQLKPV